MVLRTTTARRSAAVIAAFGIAFGSAPAISHAQATPPVVEVPVLPTSIDMVIGEYFEMDVDKFTELYGNFTLPSEGSIVVTGLPRGLKFDKDARMISGTPYRAKDEPQEVRATARLGEFERTIEIDVNVLANAAGEVKVDRVRVLTAGWDAIYVKAGEATTIDMQKYWDSNFQGQILPDDDLTIRMGLRSVEGLDYVGEDEEAVGTLAEKADYIVPVRGVQLGFLYHTVYVPIKVVAELPAGYVQPGHEPAVVDDPSTGSLSMSTISGLLDEAGFGSVASLLG